MIFHVRLHGKSTADSPSQQRFGLTTDVQRTGTAVTISMLSAGMTFTGELKGDQINGVYEQTGSRYPLTLTKIPGSEPPISALEVNGDWHGVLEKSRVPIDFHIKLGQTTTVDVPKLRLVAKPATTNIEGRTIRLLVRGTKISFEGKLENLRLTGTYRKGRSCVPVVLERLVSKPTDHSARFDGDWQGKLEKDNLLLVFHIRIHGKSTTDIPKQHLSDYLIFVSAEDETLKIAMPGADMKFEGTLHGSEIRGIYTQLQTSSPLILSRTGPAADDDFSAVASSSTQALDGDWDGSIAALNFPVLFHIKEMGKSAAENPKNHIIYDLNVIRNGSLVTIEMPGSGMKFEGTLQGSSLVGTYSQLGSSWPLTLSKKTSLAIPREIR